MFCCRLFVESGDTLTAGGTDVVGRLAQVNAVKMTVLAQPAWDDAQKAQYGLSGYYTAMTSAPAGIAFASQDFVTEGLYLAFGKQSKCGKALANPFSSGIAKLKADGTIDRIFARELERYEKTHPH